MKATSAVLVYLERFSFEKKCPRVLFLVKMRVVGNNNKVPVWYELLEQRLDNSFAMCIPDVVGMLGCLCKGNDISRTWQSSEDHEQ